MANDLNAIVVQNIEVSPGLEILRVVPDGWEFPDFTPGQFAVLGLPGSAPRCRVCDPEDEVRDPQKLIKRAYSIASSSVTKEFLELYIVLVPSGSLTPRLFNLTAGDHVWLSPKFSGLFTLEDVPEDKHIVLVSTGTGLAPYMSMLRTQLVCGGPRRSAVLHGARHSWDLGYRSELMTHCGGYARTSPMCPSSVVPTRRWRRGVERRATSRIFGNGCHWSGAGDFTPHLTTPIFSSAVTRV